MEIQNCNYNHSICSAIKVHMNMRERGPGHDGIWSMYMDAETKAPHQFEQEVQQRAVS